MQHRNQVIIFTSFILTVILVNGSERGLESLISETGETRVQLLELFSSESCSSCPPADDWVSGLKNKNNLWKNFVPIVFHVDYWNQLNWVDKLSSEPMTQRQISISKLWANPSVYTPAVVVDGKEWPEWRKSVDYKLPIPEKINGISLKLFKKNDGSFKVHVDRKSKTKSYIVHMVQLGMGVVSKVTSGENSGKLLKHNFVILNWDHKKMSTNESDVSFKFKKTEYKYSQMALAAWIEEEFKPISLQAVGGYLK